MAQILAKYDVRIALLETKTDNHLKEIEKHDKEISELKKYISNNDKRMDTWDTRLATTLFLARIFLKFLAMPASFLGVIYMIILITKAVHG